MAQEVKPISKRKGILGALALVAVALGLYWSLAVAPPDAYQGEVQRIMYLHLPSILTAYLSYFLVFVGSGMYLWKREKRDDLLAHSAAEIGVLFTALTIIEGSIWGKPTWGVWWTWSSNQLVLLAHATPARGRRGAGSRRQRTTSRNGFGGSAATGGAE